MVLIGVTISLTILANTNDIKAARTTNSSTEAKADRLTNYLIRTPISTTPPEQHNLGLEADARHALVIPRRYIAVNVEASNVGQHPRRARW